MADPADLGFFCQPILMVLRNYLILGNKCGATREYELSTEKQETAAEGVQRIAYAQIEKQSPGWKVARSIDKTRLLRQFVRRDGQFVDQAKLEE